MKSDIKCFVGKVYVSFKPLKIVKGIIIKNGRIFYAGNKAEKIAKELNCEIFYLNEKCIIPSFVDSHLHLDSLSLSLNSLDLREVKSIDELKFKLKNFYEKNKDKSFIYARGWDQENFKEKRWPTKFDIDEIIKNKFVLVERICGHAAVVNSKTLEILNEKYVNKNKGIIYESAIKKLKEKLKFKEEVSNFLIKTFNYISSFGITTCGFVSCNYFTYNILKNLKNMLKIRVRVYLNYEDINKINKNDDEFLKILGIKIFADGSLGARTALLSYPYSDDPSNLGISIFSKEKLKEIIKNVHKKKLQLAIHAIGDKAIDYVLHAYEKLGKNLLKFRHRIEHASIIREDQIEKIKRLKVCVCVQPRFIKSDWWMIKRVGKERIKWAYPFNSLIRNKIRLGFSSDSPVESLNPWEGIYYSVIRENYNLDEKISLLDALHCYTYGSAYLLFEEKNIGNLNKGKYADFVIIDKDPLEVDIKKIKEIKTIATFLKGNLIFP